MQYIKNVRSNGQPDLMQILNNQVIIPINVHPFSETIDGELIEGYQYDCNVYSKDEYLVVIAQQAKRITELEDQLAAAKILLGVDE